MASEKHVMAELERQIASAGTLLAWCGQHGISPPVVSLIRRGHRGMNETVANALGFIVETNYRNIWGKGDMT